MKINILSAAVGFAMAVFLMLAFTAVAGCSTTMSATKGFNATSAAFAAADAATAIAENTIDPENKDDLATVIEMKEHLLAATEYIITGYHLTNVGNEHTALAQFACAGEELSKVVDGLYKLGIPKTKLLVSSQAYLAEALGGTQCSNN